jgi:uncharacterized membrane protein
MARPITGTDRPMADLVAPALAPSKRLKFIDMARSVAILLMLEGHFIGATLMPRFLASANPIAVIWNFFRGLAAPLFFTAAGLVFVFLLTANKELALRQNPRVRKGLKRAMTLIATGYLLQVSLWQIPLYLDGQFDSSLSTFHVLQSIGVGLLALIGLFAIHTQFRRLPLPAVFLVAALLVLVLHGFLLHLGDYFPRTAPPIIQNMFKGPHSVFPLAPWLAFTLGGGAIGAMLRESRSHLAAKWFPLVFLAVGLVLGTLAILAIFAARAFPAFAAVADGEGWICGRAAEIMLLLGILLAIEQRSELRDSWFMRIGQYTFPIYILHAIILYGAILGGGFLGRGIAHSLKESLSPTSATFGAFLFIAFFVAIIPLFDFASSTGASLKARLFWRKSHSPRGSPQA